MQNMTILAKSKSVSRQSTGIMGRQNRKFLTRILTFGLIACCCLTFFPKIIFSSQPLQSSTSFVSDERIRKKNVENSLSFAQVAKEMKAFAETITAGSPVLKYSKRVRIPKRNFNVTATTINTSDDFPALCSQKDKRPNYLNSRASIIVSLYNLRFEDPVVLLYRILYRIPDHVTDDVIITAEDSLHNNVKQRLEEALDFCTHCRLFFLQGTIYEHRNLATKFSHEDKLVFVDARVIPTDGWIEPLLFELNYNPLAVVSPHLRLLDAEKSFSDVGLSRLELTWDLNVIRAPLTEFQKRLVRNDQVTSVNQTSILKEVMAIRKDFFTQLGLFDIIPGATGGEHVSFSLKAINCGGEILMSVCSRVYMETVPHIGSVSLDDDSETAFFVRDYHSPSFSVPKTNLTIYYDTNSKIWLDAFSNKFYSASVHRQVNYEKIWKTRMSSNSRNSFFYSRYGRFGSALKSNLLSMECQFTNFRYVVSKFQPDMVSPLKKASHYGFVRSLDGIFAFGLQPKSPFFSSSSSSSFSSASSFTAASGSWGAGKSGKSSIAKHSNNKKPDKETDKNWLTYTRNANLWIGPFSYVDGRLQYNRIWCVTALQKSLALELCQKPFNNQTFLFVNGTFRLATGGGKLCVKVQGPKLWSSQPEAVSATQKVVLLPCDIQKSNAVNIRLNMDMTLLL